MADINQSDTLEQAFRNSIEHHRSLALAMRQGQVGIKNYHEMRQAIRFLEKQIGLDFEEKTPAADLRRSRMGEYTKLVDQWLVGGTKDITVLESMLVKHSDQAGTPGMRRLAKYSFDSDPDSLVRAEYFPSVDVFIVYTQFIGKKGFPTEQFITEMTAKVLDDQTLFLEQALKLANK